MTPDNVLSAWVRPARVPKNSRGQRPRTAAPGQALAWHGENTRRSATSESRPVYFPALDASGTAFVAGTAFIAGSSASSPPLACPAYGWVPPGGSGALLGCGAYCGGLSDTQLVTLVAGDTVLYAKTFSAGTWGIVRLPKQG